MFLFSFFIFDIEITYILWLLNQLITLGGGRDSHVSFPRGSSPLTGEPGQMDPCRTHGHGPTQKAAWSPWHKDRPWDLGGQHGDGHT